MFTQAAAFSARQTGMAHSAQNHFTSKLTEPNTSRTCISKQRVRRLSLWTMNHCYCASKCSTFFESLVANLTEQFYLFVFVAAFICHQFVEANVILHVLLPDVVPTPAGNNANVFESRQTFTRKSISNPWSASSSATALQLGFRALVWALELAFSKHILPVLFFCFILLSGTLCHAWNAGDIAESKSHSLLWLSECFYLC